MSIFKYQTIYEFSRHVSTRTFFFLLSSSYFANALFFIPIDYFQQAKIIKIVKADGGARSLLDFNKRIIEGYILLSVDIVLICEYLVPQYTLFVALTIFLALALYITQALRNAINILGLGKHVSISYAMEAIVKVTSFFILVKIFKPDTSLLLYAWLASLSITGCYLGFVSMIYKIFEGQKNNTISVSEVFFFSYPFSISAVASWLQLQGYRLILVPLGFSEVVGIFATLSNIGSAAIGAASLIYSQQYTPRIYQTKGAYTKKYLKGAIVVILFVIIGCILSGKHIVTLLTTLDLAHHWKLIIFGVSIDSANLIIGALAIHITLKNSTKDIIFPSILGLLLMISFFIPIFSYNVLSIYTVGIPLLLSQWGVSLYMYYKFQRVN